MSEEKQEPLTVEEIKQIIAKEKGYNDWEHCINDQPNYKIESLMDEVIIKFSDQQTKVLREKLKSKEVSITVRDFAISELHSELTQVKEHNKQLADLLYETQQYGLPPSLLQEIAILLGNYQKQTKE